MDIRKVMQAITGAGLILYAAQGLFSQSAAPAFDVATVKPAPPSPNGELRVMMGGDAGRVAAASSTCRLRRSIHTRHW